MELARLLPELGPVPAGGPGTEPLRREVEQLARLGRVELASAPPGEEAAPAGTDLGPTTREREVPRLVAEGHSNRKLGVASRVEATVLAYRLGLVRINPGAERPGPLSAVAA